MANLKNSLNHRTKYVLLGDGVASKKIISIQGNSENREPALNVIHQSLSRKEINLKLRNSSFSCRTFLLCDGGGTILQLGAAFNYHN